MTRITNNCILIDNKLISYETHVATVEGGNLIELGKWSTTTSKHVRRAANELNLNLIKFN